MRFLEHLTKEELISLFAKDLSLDEEFDIVHDALMRRIVKLKREGDATGNNTALYSQKHAEISRIYEHLIVMQDILHNQDNPDYIPPKDFREWMKRTQEKNKNYFEELDRKHWEEMEKKYG